VIIETNQRGEKKVHLVGLTAHLTEYFL